MKIIDLFESKVLNSGPYDVLAVAPVRYRLLSSDISGLLKTHKYGLRGIITDGEIFVANPMYWAHSAVLRTIENNGFDTTSYTTFCLAPTVTALESMDWVLSKNSNCVQHLERHDPWFVVFAHERNLTKEDFSQFERTFGAFV